MFLLFLGNIAVGKLSSQISTFGNNLNQYGPSNAINGTFGNDVTASQCAKTGDVMNSWWKVDLGYEHVIMDITVFGSSNSGLVTFNCKYNNCISVNIFLTLHL